MNKSRREFLKKGGLVLAGLGCAGVPLARVLASGARTAPAASSSPRWGMVVDLAACRGRGQGDCRDCLDACRLAHNLPNLRHPEWDQRHDVKWIWKEAFDDAFPSRPAGPAAGAVPVLCNHCENPPCVRVCPTGATWKREDGLVMMDQHRCIGCRYCVAACPYGSRSFNFVDPRRFIDRPLNPDYPTRTRGVVEKCNFCAERLAVGGQPACVEACPQGALHFGDVSEPRSAVSVIKRARRVIVRKPQLGTDPHVYYLE